MKQYNSRREKIHYLKQLLQGNTSINELCGHIVRHWHNSGDGIWRDENGRMATNAELNNRNTHNIFHVHSNMPISQSEEEVV